MDYECRYGNHWQDVPDVDGGVHAGERHDRARTRARAQVTPEGRLGDRIV